MKKILFAILSIIIGGCGPQGIAERFSCDATNAGTKLAYSSTLYNSGARLVIAWVANSGNGTVLYQSDDPQLATGTAVATYNGVTYTFTSSVSGPAHVALSDGTEYFFTVGECPHF